jgi:hypothetical protein
MRALAIIAVVWAGRAAAAGRVEVAAWLGYAAPVGSAERGARVGDTTFGHIPIELDAAYRLTPRVALVARVQYGARNPSSSARPSSSIPQLRRVSSPEPVHVSESWERTLRQHPRGRKAAKAAAHNVQVQSRPETLPRTSPSRTQPRPRRPASRQARYVGTRKNLYDLRRAALIQNLEIAQRRASNA